MSSNFWGTNTDNIDLERAKNSLITDLKYLMSLGFVESHRSHNTGIGKTIEDLMDVEENNLSVPDYKGCIELKSQRAFTGSMLSLFTKSPSYPSRANNTLRERFGHPTDDSIHNVLHTTIKHSEFNRLYNTWGFKLDIDEENRRLILLIKNLATNEIEDFQPYWNFDDLNPKITEKCSLIAYITADTKTVDDIEYFHFKKVVLLSGLTSEKFFNSIREDLILFDIRIGAYKSGKHIGKSHDHGSGFRVKRANLSRIFDIEEISLDESRDTTNDLDVINDSQKGKRESFIQKKLKDF